jgi:DNA-binding CsgD family transcriptional regulator
MKNNFTEQQSKVCKLILEGLSEEEIAIFLGVGSSTVKRHINNLFQKTGTTTRKELAIKISLQFRDENLHGCHSTIKTILPTGKDSKGIEKKPRFGAFLLEKNLISREDLIEALDFQTRSTMPMGKIAVLTGDLNKDQVLEILDAQLKCYPLHFRFGEIGIRFEYLDPDKINNILEHQKIFWPYLGEALLKLRKMKYETAEQALSQYEQLISPDKLPVMCLRIF